MSTILPIDVALYQQMAQSKLENEPQGISLVHADYIGLPSPASIGNSSANRAGGPFSTVFPVRVLQAVRVRIERDITVSKASININVWVPGANVYFGLYDLNGNLKLELKFPADAPSPAPLSFAPVFIPAGMYLWVNGTDEDFNSQAAAITNISVAANVVTVVCNNSFFNGQVVFPTGITTATFLNGQKLTITAATPTQFTAAFVHAAYGPAADTGTVIATDGQIKATGFLFDNFFLNAYGFRVKETIAGGHLPPVITNAFMPNVANINGSKCSANVLTVYADTQGGPLPASFVPGSKVTCGSVSTSTFLAGVELTILTADYRSFTAAFVHADYNSVQEAAFAAIVPSALKAAITNIQIASGIATITCAAGHPFNIGDCVEHTGMTTVAGLNSGPWPILPTGFSPTTYQVVIFQADVAPAAETGIAVPAFRGNNNYLYSSPNVILQ